MKYFHIFLVAFLCMPLHGMMPHVFHLCCKKRKLEQSWLNNCCKVNPYTNKKNIPIRFAYGDEYDVFMEDVQVVGSYGQERNQVFIYFLEQIQRGRYDADMPLKEWGYVWHYVIEQYGDTDVMPQEQWDDYFRLLLRQKYSCIQRKAYLSPFCEYSPLYILLFKYRVLPAMNIDFRLSVRGHVIVDMHELNYMCLWDVDHLRNSVRALKILKEEKVAFDDAQVCTYADNYFYTVSLLCVCNSLYIFAAPLGLEIELLNTLVEDVVELCRDNEFGHVMGGCGSQHIPLSHYLQQYECNRDNIAFKNALASALLKKEMQHEWRYKLLEKERLQQLCAVNFRFG
jgi:hypothetical protein